MQQVRDVPQSKLLFDDLLPMPVTRTTEEQPSRVAPDNALTSKGDLHLVITEAGIVATMTGTNFLVEYRKVKGTPWLTVSHVRNDATASMKKAEFLAWAWKAANDEARALGWII